MLGLHVRGGGTARRLARHLARASPSRPLPALWGTRLRPGPPGLERLNGTQGSDRGFSLVSGFVRVPNLRSTPATNPPAGAWANRVRADHAGRKLAGIDLSCYAQLSSPSSAGFAST